MVYQEGTIDTRGFSPIIATSDEKRSKRPKKGEANRDWIRKGDQCGGDEVSAGLRERGMKLIKINFLNIQGLSQRKFMEIENKMENDIFLLVETQLKQDKLKHQEKTRVLNKMRDITDRKGGGLMTVWRENSNINIEEIKTKHRDIMMIKCNMGKKEFFCVIIYMSTNDLERNLIIKKELVEIINKMEENNLMIVGDFNGHIGFVGEQEINKNGKIVLSLMEENNLILMNDDERCKGVTTWQQGNKKSSIDFVLCNMGMNELIKRMKIDEEREEIDLSDHNLITIDIEIENKGKKFSKAQDDEETIYYRINENNRNQFIEEIKEELRKGEVEDIEGLEREVKRKADKMLKVVKKRKIDVDQNKEPIWYDKEINKEIAIRREINKKRRTATNDEEKNRLWNQYKKQKEKVGGMVQEAVTRHEEEVTAKIMNDDNRNRKTWKYIKMLKNRDIVEKRKQIEIYNSNGNKLSKENTKTELVEKWKKIYQSSTNEIPRVWNNEEKIKYKRMREEEENNRTLRINYRVVNRDNLAIYRIQTEQIIVPEILREHMDMAFRIPNPMRNMKKPYININDIRKVTKRMKAGKASGPDGIKPEIYKAITEDDELTLTMAHYMNEALDSGKIPVTWKESNTTLIPKTSKPQVNELRPIALTNIAYKIFMGIIKSKLEEHLEENKLMDELQAGATKGRETIDNVQILQYCIEKTFERKQELYLISIDFAKAFDSVNREIMISTLKDFKIHTNVINVIANIYNGDQTNLKLNNEELDTINITSGIRQGCNGSALLFIIVTYKIILEIRKTGYGFKDDNIYIPALFYMDDGILLANNKTEIEELINILIKKAEECGLRLNRDKCIAMIFNKKGENEQRLQGISVEKELKYLGITINNQRQWYTSHTKKLKEKAMTLSNQIYQIIGRSCNRLMIGKTFWKGVALPSILYGQEIMPFDKSTIEKLQRIENKVFRGILNLPTYTATEFLRGEIGASSMKWRITRSKLMYINRKLKSEKNDLLKRIIIKEMNEGTCKWVKHIRKEIDYLNMEQAIETYTKGMIWKLTSEKDSEEWKAGMQNKVTLTRYSAKKNEIKEEKWFKNDNKYMIMMKARSDTLNLMWRSWGSDQQKACPLCGHTLEDLKHFLVDCNALQPTRNKCVELQRPVMLDNGEQLINKMLLLEEGETEMRNQYLDLMEEMWKTRRKIIEEKEEENRHGAGAI